MKLIHLKNIIKEEVANVLSEIGDVSAAPYEFTAYHDTSNSDSVTPDRVYRFTSESGLDYRIDLESQKIYTGGYQLDVSFRLVGSMYNMTTNAGEQFKIMATVVAAVKDYLKEFPQITEISFTAIKAHERENDDRRAKLYLAYIKKQLPNAEVSLQGIRYTIKLPKPVSEHLNEIGDASIKPYALKLQSIPYRDSNAPDVAYQFKTDSGLVYDLTLDGRDLESIDEFSVDISFKLAASASYSTQTNKGEQFKIMATVVDATKKYLKDYPKVNKVTFMPVKSDDKNKDVDSNRREKLYIAYVKNALKDEIPVSAIHIRPTGLGVNKITIELDKNRKVTEQINLFLEKNTPTDPAKWAYYKAQAKKKFDVYPSAYANGWAAKKYKAAGGGWRKEK